ncbi:MAG: hypothetical protein V2B15_04040 [Bacteroidota bacterium]
MKRQIIAGIDREELVLLKFTEEESRTRLQWKHSKEFEYNKQMYDIVKTEIKGDTSYYWCWLDSKETKLNEQLDELLNAALRKDPGKKENQERLANFYKSLFCEQLADWHLHAFQTEQSLFSYYFNYLTISFPPPVPPPKMG